MAVQADLARLGEAFARAPDPAAYVPRLALESALAALTEGIGKTPACTALSGEAGLGKTLLLHVLRDRLGGSFECLYLPDARLTAPELWRWLATELGLGHGVDDRAAVLGRARRLAADGLGLVLLVDDAGALSPGVRMQLLTACGTPGLSLVLAFDAADAAQLASLPPQVRRVELGPPMTLPELRAYVHARLRRAGLEETLGPRLGPAQLAKLHAESGGVPARLHALLVGPSTEAARPLAPPAAPAAPAAHPPARHAASPRTQLAIAALLVGMIAAFWTFALQRGPGVASVGVPVEPFAPPRQDAAPAPEPPPAAPEMPATPAPLPGRDTGDAVAAEVTG